MSWQLLTMISVLFLSMAVILQRLLMHKDKVNPYAYAVVFQAIVGVILLTTTLIFGFKLPNFENLLIPAAIATVAFGVGSVMYAKTLQIVEASVFSVLFASQAIWIMLLGIIMFGEKLMWVQILGSVLIFSSILLLIQNYHSLKFDKGTCYGLLTGLLYGIAIFSWSFVGRYTDPLSWAAVSFILTSIFVFITHPKVVKTIPTLLTKQRLSKLIVLGIFYAISSIAMLLAYKYGTFSLVTPLQQVSIIVTVLLALIFLPPERNRIVTKLIAAVICLGGAMLIVAG